jgi:hypothetical protein
MLGLHMFCQTGIVAEPMVAPRGPTGNVAKQGRCRLRVVAWCREICHGSCEELGLELQIMS